MNIIYESKYSNLFIIIIKLVPAIAVILIIVRKLFIINKKL